MDHSASHNQPGGFFSSRWNIGLIVLLAVAGFYLITEHQAHVFGVLPFLLILLCPLMHFFMHGAHGGHGGGGDDRSTSGASQPPGAHQH